jgi:hypothetical protein
VSQSKVKIISGWSDPGGSTLAHISLTNLLNDNGIDCTFHGPHEYHLDKCKSGTLDQYPGNPEDIVITHFIRFRNKIPFKKHIFSCHEKDIWSINKMIASGKQDLADYDAIHFVSNLQKEWQAIDHGDQVIIPPIVEKVSWTPPKEKVAGIIGSVDRNKQVHISINRALNGKGYDKVLVFGAINDLPYFNDYVAPFVSRGKVVMVAHESDREAMYGQISEVFHSSLSETYGLVEAECKLSGIPFNGKGNGQEILEKEEILKRWINILK